jgi:hypothetical protein
VIGAVGANVGRNGQQTRTQDVQRCSTDHVTNPPGPTVTVNGQGAPRA